MPVVNIRDYGALGDGQDDDTASIQRAVAILRADDTLYFPAGTYRIATLGTLVSIQGISKLRVFFNPQATLLMDNLNAQGLGSGHAFYFKGYADGLILEGIRIRWRTMPAQRSMGDGIRIDGPYSSAGPSDQRTIRNIVIKSCYVAQAPQAGIVLMGCSDITIDTVEIVETWADGVHLNACRHYTIRNITGLNVRDDHVALVTYYDPSTTDFSLGDREGGPYTQPTLGDWSNYKGKISDVRSDATRRFSANGIRVAGALDVEIDNLRAHLRKASIIVDAGRKGNTYGWEYQASQKIRVRRVTATQCHVGVHVMTFNVLPNEATYWDFGVSLDELSVQDCELDNLLIEKCSGITIDRVESNNGRVRIINVNNIQIGILRSQRGDVLVHGLTALARSLKFTPIPSSNITIETLTVRKGEVQLANAKRIRVGDLRVDDSQSEIGCVFVNVQEGTVSSLVSQLAQKKGLQITNCQSLIIISVLIASEQNDFTSLEIGGGNSSSVSKNISIVSAVYQGASNRPDISIQQGRYAPRQLSVRLVYGSTPEKAMKQRHYRLD